MKSKSPILIVEDNYDWIEILKPLLSELDFECYFATNYIDAIKIIKRNSPLALILDLNLGSGNLQSKDWEGWQLAQEAKDCNISSIILSGYSYETHIERAFIEFGVIGFFSKGQFAERKIDFIQRVIDAVAKTIKKQSEKIVFISYSHMDTKWLGIFKKNLKVLTKNHPITIWDDTNIKSGSKWKEEIDKALLKADVAILLITPDYLASDFIEKFELPVLLEASENGNLKILWIAVKLSLVDETVIADYQAVNDPSKPLNSLSDADSEKEIVNICKKILDALK